MRHAARSLAIALVLSAVGSHRTVGADVDRFRTAARHYAQEQWAAACDELKLLLAEQPEHPRASDARFFYGEALAQLGRHAEARAQFIAFLQGNPVHRYARQALFRSGECAYLDGNDSEARRDLEAYYAQYPDDDSNAYVLAYLGAVELSSHHVREAKQRYGEALRQYPHGPLAEECRQGLYQLAESAYAAEDFSAARELFASLIGSDAPPETIRRGLSGLAWCHFKTGNWSEAAANFDRVLTQFPECPLAAEAALLRGECLERLGQLDPAIAMYHLVVDRYPESERAAAAMWRAARLHDQLQQQMPAVERYSRLIREYPNFSELDAALYRCAWLLERTGQVAAAQALYARLRHDFPDSRYAADATLRFAELAVAVEQYSEAEPLLAAITSYGTPAAVRQHALYLQGRLAYVRGKWDAVAPPLVQLVENFPDGELTRSAVYLMAEASYRLGDYTKAVERLAQLTSSKPSRDEPWLATAELRRAQALAQLKEWSQALEVAQAMPARFRDFEELYEVDYLIGRVRAAQADFAAARTAYAKVVESPRGRETQTAAMAQWMIGESYFHQENYAAALAEYAKVDAYKFPRWRAAALLQAGKCQEILGQWQSAADSYDMLLSTFPTSEYSDEATRRKTAALDRLSQQQRGSAPR